MANLPAPSSSMQVFPKAQFLDPSYSSIFIDDITLDISSTSILYADDVTLMSFIKSKEERIPAAASLNQDLCNIEKWATSWNVPFGATKCKTVTISNRQDAKDSHPCLQFFGTTLTESETVELLGLTLSKDLSWKHDVTSMAKSAAQRTSLLRRVAPYLLPIQRAMIYKAIIRSKMEYASFAWFGATPTSLSHRKTQMSHLTHLNHSGSVHGQNDSKICKKWVFCPCSDPLLKWVKWLIWGFLCTVGCCPKACYPDHWPYWGWPHLSPNSATGNPKRSWSPHIVPPYVLWRGPGTALSADSWTSSVGSPSKTLC